MEALFDLFGHFCGQQIDHTWLPGGVPLPVCQRCTGLYVGAALAVGLMGWFRPRLGGWFLLVHGAFLLGIAPFRLDWIEDGPEMRTITGFLYGAAVAVLLARWPVEVLGSVWSGQFRFEMLSGQEPSEARRRPSRALCRDRAGAWGYWIALGAGVVVLPLFCGVGGDLALWVLAAGIAAGGLSLVLLLILNVLAFIWLVARRRGVGAAPA